MIRNWTKEQIKDHKEAGLLLGLVMGEAFNFIKEKSRDITEFEVQQFILGRFDYYNMTMERSRTPIVAFGTNTSNVHYYPDKNSSSKLLKNSLIMIDIWARLNKKGAPFADITWMGYFGENIPKEIMCEVNLVFEARDRAFNFVKESLRRNEVPVGLEVDHITRDFLRENNRAKNFLHTTGHVLGLVSPHGVTAGLRHTNRRQILLNIGYTIEPGIYFKDKFGVRSEINFYIDKNMEVVLTTGLQSKLIMV